MISAACVVWIGWIVPYVGWGDYGQPSATLWKDQLFVATGWGWNAYDVLYRGPFESSRKTSQSPVQYWRGSSREAALPCSQAKLEIKENRLLWFMAGNSPLITPLTELQYLENNDFGRELCRTRKDAPEQHLLAGLYAGSPDLLLFPGYRKSDIPDPKATGYEKSGYPREVQIGWWQHKYRLRARFDLQIAASKSVRLFHAYEDQLFISVEPDYLSNWYWDHKTLRPKEPILPPPDRELRTGKLPAEFTERFAAYTSDKRDYLVTDNGKVYMAVPKGKAEVEVSAVWSDPKQRIVGVVQDQANDAVYGWGFVTDSAASERFYVKMDPKPVAVAYKRTVPLWDDRSDAYLESYECARAFRKAEKK